MENTQNNMTSYSSGDNKKTVIVTIVAGAAVLIALIWWMSQSQVSRQVGVSPTSDPEAAAINQEVDSVNAVGDLNAELDVIDKDLQGL